MISNKIFSFQKQEASRRLPKILEDGNEIFVPLCPDYIPGGISDGVSSLMISALQAVSEVQSKYPKNFFIFLIADTEEDIFIDFPRDNIKTSEIKFSQEILSQDIKGKVSLFSNQFKNWHIRQYELEDKIRDSLPTDSELNYFFLLYQEKRKERYSLQYNRELSIEETSKLQIRHYAQYILLREIMYEMNKKILMNYATENLRGITKNHSFLAQNRQKLEVIVY